MRKHIFFFSLLFLLASCGQQEHLKIPKSSNPWLMVAHIKEPVLSFVDLEQGEIIETEQFPFMIHSMVRVVEEQVAIAGRYEDTVKLIHLDTGNIENLLTSFSEITSLLYAEQTDTLFMTDAQKNLLHFFELDTRKISARVAVDPIPVSMSLSPTLQHIYVLSSQSNSISVIDTEKKELISSFPVIEHPTQVLSVPPYVWVSAHGSTNSLNEAIYIYHPDSGELVDKIKVGLMPIAMYADPFSNYVFVLCHGSDELFVIEKESKEVVHSVDLAANPYYLLGDEKHIYVTSLDGNQLHIIDKETFNVKQSISMPEGPYSIVLGGKKP